MPLHETDELVLLNPSAPIRRALIWCHGLGADGHDFVPMAQALNLPPTHATRFIFPHAPHDARHFKRRLRYARVV